MSMPYIKVDGVYLYSFMLKLPNEEIVSALVKLVIPNQKLLSILLTWIFQILPQTTCLLKINVLKTLERLR